MFSVARAAIVMGAMGGVIGLMTLGGCASPSVGPYSGPIYVPTASASLPGGQERRRLARQRRPVATTAVVVDEQATVGTTVAPRPYSSEWWAQERAREARENERLMRIMDICRGC